MFIIDQETQTLMEIAKLEKIPFIHNGKLYLFDQVGQPFIERCRDLAVKVVCFPSHNAPNSCRYIERFPFDFLSPLFPCWFLRDAASSSSSPLQYD